MSIIKDFLFGNMPVDEHHFKHEPEYDEAMKILLDSEKELLNKLDDDEIAVFQRYRTAQEKISSLESVDSLTHGFKLGLTMTAEAFVETEEDA